MDHATLALVALVATATTAAQIRRYLVNDFPLSKPAQTEVDGILSGLFKK